MPATSQLSNKRPAGAPCIARANIQAARLPAAWLVLAVGLLGGLTTLRLEAAEFEPAVVSTEYSQPAIALTDFLQEEAPQDHAAILAAEPLENAEPLDNSDESVLFPESPTEPSWDEPTTIAPTIHVDPAVEPAACYNCRDCMSYVPHPAYPCDSSGCRTMSCLSGPYFKTGWNGVFADGIFDDSDQIGYNFALGYRQPMGFGFGGRRLFLDMGGSFMSAFGTAERTVRGKQTNTNTNAVAFVDDAYRVTLTEVRRTGLHGGVGWYFGSLFDTPSEDPQARLGLIVGGRFANMHGVKDLERLIAPPANNTQVSLAKTTDMSGGIYVNLEWLLLRRNSPIGDLQWTIDGELAHDWVDFEGFEQRGLATASLLFGVLVAR